MYHTLRLGPERLRSEYDKQEANVDPSIDDRFRDNAALIRTGLWLIIDYLESNGIAVDSYQQGYEIIPIHPIRASLSRSVYCTENSRSV